MRRQLIFSLLFTGFVSFGAFAAAPALSFDPTGAIVTVAPGHRVAWVTTWHSSSAYQSGITGPAGADGVVRITPGVGVRGTWIVADAETGEWTARASVENPSGFSTFTWEPNRGTPVLAGPTGAFSVLERRGDTFGGGLWIRPGVGVWGPAWAGWDGPYTLTSGEEVVQVDISRLPALGSSPATPAGLARGDVLLLLSPNQAAGGVVDPILDADPFAGYLTFQKYIYAQQFDHYVEGRTVTLDVVRHAGTAGTVTTTCRAALDYGLPSWAEPANRAMPGVDYVDTAPQSLTFAPGETVKRCTFTLLDDGVYTDVQRFMTIVLTPPTGGAHILSWRGVQPIMLDDDDPAPVLTFGEVPASVAEGDVTWSIPVQWSLNGAFRGTVQVTAGGTLHDVTPETRSRTSSLTVVADDVQGATASRNLVMQLRPLSSASRIAPVSRTVTVVEDDAATLNVSINAPATVPEGDSGTLPVTITVRFGAPMPVPVTLQLATSGTASADVDYTRLPQTLEFVPGQTEKSITFRINGDLVTDNGETIIVTATRDGVVMATATMTIVDNDDPRPAVTVTAAPVAEGNTGTTTATVFVRLATAYSKSLTFSVNTGTTGTATPGLDYVAASTSVKFSAGETEKTVPLIVNGDTIDENDETVPIVVLFDGSSVSTPSPSSTTTALRSPCSRTSKSPSGPARASSPPCASPFRIRRPREEPCSTRRSTARPWRVSTSNRRREPRASSRARRASCFTSPCSATR